MKRLCVRTLWIFAANTLQSKGDMTNMKNYISPEMTFLALQSEEVMTASEESFDINVSFEELWGDKT